MMQQELNNESSSKMNHASRLGTFATGNDLSLVVPDVRVKPEQHAQAGFYAKAHMGAAPATVPSVPPSALPEPLSAPPGKGRPPLMRQSSSKRKLGAQDNALLERGRSRKRSTTVRSLQIVNVPSLDDGLSSPSSDYSEDSDDDDDGAAPDTDFAVLANAGGPVHAHSAANFHPGQHDARGQRRATLDPLTIESPDSFGSSAPAASSRSSASSSLSSTSDADESAATQEYSVGELGPRRSSTFTICNGLDTVFIGEDDATPSYSRKGEDFDWDSSQDESSCESEPHISMLDLPAELDNVNGTTWSSEADAMWAASQILAPNCIEEEVNCNRALSDSALPPPTFYNTNPPPPPSLPAQLQARHMQQQAQQQQFHRQQHMQQQQQQQQAMPYVQMMPGLPGAQPQVNHHAAAAAAASAAEKSKIKEKANRALSGSKICFRRLWTPEEDALLISLVKRHGLGHWSDISQHFHSTKSPNQCSQRWHKALDPSIKKGKWTKEEDKALVAAVEECGKHWREIARHIPGRTGKQCRDRYTSRLDPSIQNDAPWTSAEEQTILEAHKRLGNKWAAIQRLVPHRSWYSVKWRISILRKQEKGIPHKMQKDKRKKQSAA